MTVQEWAILVAWLIFSIIYWKIYPYTLSLEDRFNLSPIGNFIGRFLFSLFGPPITVMVVIFGGAFILSIFSG